jgi:hypothetical protein
MAGDRSRVRVTGRLAWRVTGRGRPTYRFSSSCLSFLLER